MEEVRAEVQEAQKNRKVVQKLSTDSMSALLGDTRRPYPGKEKAHEEALMRSEGKWYVGGCGRVGVCVALSLSLALSLLSFCLSLSAFLSTSMRALHFLFASQFVLLCAAE